ncbi:MAG: hypothetical protein ACMG6H_06275, partial [Acidobacteriota bacterium]
MRALFRVAPRVAAALLVLSLSLMVYAQGDAGNKRSNPGSSSGPAGGGKVEKTRTVYVDRPGPPGHDRIIRVLPKTGALTIVAESGASLR